MRLVDAGWTPGTLHPSCAIMDLMSGRGKSAKFLATFTVEHTNEGTAVHYATAGDPSKFGTITLSRRIGDSLSARRRAVRAVVNYIYWKAEG